MHQRAPGLIPAHAGKTGHENPTYLPGMAHPRSRGENIVEYATSPVLVGSSPLTRGKPAGLARRGYADGLIPAHAGKTQGRRDLVCHWWAHPRSRGENQLPCINGDKARGSSPLTRGKPRPTIAVWPPLRLIPAHAGKTGPCRAGERPGGAHPRSRGENAVRIASRAPVWGSSPLTRGKLGFLINEREADGLIPAHAGKTVA